MRSNTAVFMILSCALPLALSACQAADASGRADDAGTAATQASDTLRQRVIYARIDRAHDSLMTRYAAVGAQLSTDQQRLYQSMNQMYLQGAAFHGPRLSDSVTAGGGRMRGGAMMRDGGMRGGAMMGSGRMMGGGRYGGMGMGGLREWDQQMLGMHQAMAALHRQSGAQELAVMNEQMARLYEQALQDTPAGTVAPPERAGTPANGSEVFTENCAVCHGANGRGMAGVFPPLAVSEWVTGEARVPVRIVLFGLQGSVEVGGATFNGTMPAFGARLTDEELAAVLSYVRSSWGNDAPAISPDDVKAVREADAARTRPFTSGELR